MTKQADSILLGAVGRQEALATAQEDIGWKLRMFTLFPVESFYGFNQPVQSLTIVGFAKISFHLVSGGCINSTHGQ